MSSSNRKKGDLNDCAQEEDMPSEGLPDGPKEEGLAEVTKRKEKEAPREDSVPKDSLEDEISSLTSELASASDNRSNKSMTEPQRGDKG